MDQLSLCWRGLSGTGKRTALIDALKGVAAMRGLPFSIQMRADTVVDETEETGQIMHETSLVHLGMDVARMSMQDKNILRPVFAKMGAGSQVLTGTQGRGCRILVLYHAHLLSSESVLLLHSCLEQNEGDVSIWLTSELPVPQRIRDWFIEIPTRGGDRAFEAFSKSLDSTTKSLDSTTKSLDSTTKSLDSSRQSLDLTSTPIPKAIGWPDIFRAIIDKWVVSPKPVMHDIKEVKVLVYEMLMRNLRWTEAVHYIMDATLDHNGLSLEQRQKVIKILAGCDATGGGYTIPSYRIPIMWENLLIQLRSVLSKESVEQVDARPKRVIIRRKKGVVKAPATVA
jgi:hypothetical protein